MYEKANFESLFDAYISYTYRDFKKDFKYTKSSGVPLCSYAHE